ncbi:phage tail protein [Streptomyces noursei]|uniref:phage tail protein n=1 Tax=Streptomyces noursei TaxID=1971 RepID=UPI0023B7EDF2|nr:phage tail protein [Streptomyces noursei]
MSSEETPDPRHPAAVTIELGAFQVETVRSVSGPAFDTPPSDEDPFTHGMGHPGEVTIVRGPDKSAALTDWLTRCLVEGGAAASRQAVTVVHYAADRTPLRRYHLAGALPTAWETPGVGTDPGADEEWVTLAYEELTVTA